mgnify:CR=1 FL=1
MQPCDLVLFGTYGDLARRKLIPSLYQLERAGLIAPDSTIIGVARRESNDEGYVALARESLSASQNFECGLRTQLGHAGCGLNHTGPSIVSGASTSPSRVMGANGPCVDSG